MENNETVQQEAAVAQPELTITDLQNIRTLVETAVRRGVFQAPELSSVGAIYDRLNNFLNAVQAAKTENQ